MDTSTNTYVALILNPNSPYISNPTSITSHTSLINLQMRHVGNVGALDDTHLFSIPKNVWEQVQEQVMATLKGIEGVDNVQVQVPRQRAKRAGGEL